MRKIIMDMHSRANFTLTINTHVNQVITVFTFIPVYLSLHTVVKHVKD